MKNLSISFFHQLCTWLTVFWFMGNMIICWKVARLKTRRQGIWLYAICAFWGIFLFILFKWIAFSAPDIDVQAQIFFSAILAGVGIIFAPVFAFKRKLYLTNHPSWV